MANIIHSISKPIFDWVLTKTSATFSGFYNAGAPLHYDGKDWALIFMLLISVVGVLCYYFGVAQKLKNATATNYLIVFGLGIVLLLAFNFFVIPNCITPKFPIKKIWDLNLLKFCLVDILYYTIMYEVWSLIFKGLSKDNHQHLFNILFSRK